MHRPKRWRFYVLSLATNGIAKLNAPSRYFRYIASRSRFDLRKRTGGGTGRVNLALHRSSQPSHSRLHSSLLFFATALSQDDAGSLDIKKFPATDLFSDGGRDFIVRDGKPDSAFHFFRTRIAP